MENRISTNIEQSKHLLELGLDPKTADMCWEMKKGNWLLDVGRKSAQVNRGFAIPAWSLSALLEVVPKNLLPTLEWRDGENEWEVYVWVDHNIHSISHYDKLIAAYEMVCWLLEQGLIKKEGQDGK